jgi:two-component system, NarL family, sensor histidine kinase BarA
MSYRSIKRVLGETSLERKCRFLFGAYLLLQITASFWWYGSQTEELVHQQNRISGRLLADQAMYIKHWETWGVEDDDETTDPALFAASQEFLKLLTENLSKEEYRWEFVSPGEADQKRLRGDDEEGGQPRSRDIDWGIIERMVRDELARPPDSETPIEPRERLLTDRNEYQYYKPIYATPPFCATCHGALGHRSFRSPPSSALEVAGGVPALSDGDLMYVAVVTIPNGPTQQAINWNRAILLSTAIITVFLAMVASYAIVRYVIVKPLRHLRDVSDAVSRGNTALRAEIHTGDEFESLAVAFNRMLRHLVAAQEELRGVNADLDAKVDELAQVNMRLYELNTIKSDFLATMSHELRTPLNSILGFSEVLGAIDSLDEKQKRYVENIRKSGRMLLEMINDILDLAKIESGKMDVRLADFRIEPLVHAQCELARPLAEKKSIDLETEVEANLPPLCQDQARVQQILNNLLSNAVKFTPEGGRIRVSARRDAEGQLVLQVADTGVGIAEEDQQAIFEKFRQGQTAMPAGDPMTREYSGTGLGLSIVKELYKLLGGGVSVESELGKGSTFTVRLPWRLEQQPRLDSPLAEEFREFTKARFDHLRDRGRQAAAAPGE